MNKTISTEAVLERLSILRGYLLDNARLQEESGHVSQAVVTRSEANGITLAMDAVRKEAAL